MDFIRECLNQLKLRLRLDTAIVDKLEEYEQRLYALEEANKLLKARNQIQDEKLAKLLLVVQNEAKVLPRAETAAPQKTGY